MAVKYVSDFTFAPSPPRPTIKGYARGGHVRSTLSPDIGATRTEKSSGVQKPAFAKGGHWIAGAIKHPGALHKEMGIPQGQKIPAAKLKAAAGKGGKLGQRARLAETLKGMHKSKGGSAKCYAEGGSVAAGKIPNKGRNPDDSVSPGSFKRTPMGQGEKNSAAANSKFSAEGRNTPVATKQDGDVQRMTGYSDFAKGGSAFNRIKNLGHYAHGGKVQASRSEKPSGKAGSGAIKAPVKAQNASKLEGRAGTPKTSPGSRVEMKSGTAKAAMGGLSRGTSSKKNAAIHAKQHKPHGAGPGLAALAGALSGAQMPHQSPMGGPGMAPGMGAPPGGPMGGMAPQGPGVGGAPPPAMSHGGLLKSFTHVAYK